MNAPLRIGTRGSALARWQAEHVAKLLTPHPVEMIIIRTQGDRDSAASLASIGGEGAFAKEIQHALLAGTIDVAVHSLKDLPTEPTAGLELASVPERAPASDVLISNKYRTLDEMPAGATLATGSPRRQAIIKHRRPDLQFVDIRGNVDSRIKKLDAGACDGLILAQAGLIRLGLENRIAEVLDPAWMIPAVGQGALGIECRTDDRRALALLQPLNHLATFQAISAERAFLRTCGGGCRVPIGAHATVDGDQLRLRAVILVTDSSSRKDGQQIGPASDAKAIGFQLANELHSS